MTNDIENSYLFLGLTEEQETQLTNYVEKSRHEIDQNKDARIELLDAMEKVKASVDTLVSRK